MFYKINYLIGGSCNLLNLNIALEMIKNNEFDHIFDVRSNEEYEKGNYPGSINIPHDLITNENTNKFSKNSKILIYCRSGRRAELAVNKFMSLGFNNLFYIKESYDKLLNS